MRIRAVLFDMGGVLLDLRGSGGVPTGKSDWRGREVLLRHLNARGANLSEDDLERIVFEPWRREYQRRQEVGVEADWSEHMKRLRKRAGGSLRTPTARLLGLWFAPLADQIEPISGAREVLEALHARELKMAVVSNVPLPGALYARLLESWNLAPFFERMYFSYDEGHRKPSPALLRKALADLEVEAGAALMVGDRRSADVAAGRAAGVATVWLRGSDGGGPSPDLTIDSLAELPALL